MFQNDQKNNIASLKIFRELREKISTIVSSELNFEKILSLPIFDGYYQEEDKIKEYFIDHFLIFFINNHFLSEKKLWTDIADQRHILEQYKLKILEKIPYFKSILNKLQNDLEMDKLIEKNLDDTFFNRYINDIPRVYENTLLAFNRKKLGLFSTPQYIVEYIIQQIFLLSVDNKPKTKLKILDNSCGLGNFLINIGEYLGNKYDNRNRDVELYGIDINEVALQILLLRVLSRNILSERMTLKVIYDDALTMKFKSIKFDVIIGNPPYYIIAKKPKNMRKNGIRPKRSHKTYISETKLKNYLKYHSSRVKQINVFNLFIENAVKNLKNEGYLGYIIPDILLTGKTSQEIRAYILKTCKIIQIVKIKDTVFSEGGVSNIILILQKENKKDNRDKNEIKIIDTETSELKDNNTQKCHYIEQNIFNLLPSHNFAIDIKPEDWKKLKIIQDKLKNNKLIPLGKIVKIGRGMEIGKSSDKIFSIDEIKDEKELKNNENLVKVISIDNISRYFINYNDKNFSNKLIIYDPNNIKIYKRKEMYTREKIVLKRISNKLIAAIDIENKYFCLDSIQIMNLKQNSEYSLYYLLGVLNSEFLNKYYQLIYGNYKKLFSRVNKSYLVRLPIPKVSKDDQKQVERLVKHILRRKPEENSDKIINEIINKQYFN
ncbi:MAG: hypothetical protein EU549_00460 [Promethearchaeota archaeon]|nr:MAG: hypothetical protein EU549_00460 [Candidatus Lokiarchaeota archaeon]